MDLYFADKFYSQHGFDATGFAKAFNKLNSAAAKKPHNYRGEASRMSDTPIPQNIDAEKAVLGAVLQDNKTIVDLPPEFTPEAFYIPSHGHIFAAMLALWGTRGADRRCYRRSGSFWTWHFRECLGGNSRRRNAESVRYHAGQVLTAFRQRRTINLVRDALRDLQESPQLHDKILSRLYSSFDQVDPSRIRSDQDRYGRIPKPNRKGRGVSGDYPDRV